MALKYCCTNKNCSYPGSTRYEITFKTETVIDQNNIAASFCPFCKQEMTPAITPDVAADPKSDQKEPPSRPA